jgi:phage-related protein
MSTELAIGNYLTLAGPNVTYRFQNFHIAQSATYQGQTYQFLPFGFSGVTINRNGDNTEATLVFPNNDLSRNWAVSALEQRWLATVYVMALDPDDRTTGTRMHRYVGQVAQGTWDEASLNLSLNTVLDAVGADAPMRRLTQQLIGALPVTSNVRLQ